MTSFRLNARRPIDPPADDGFEVSYVPDDGAVHRMPLARAWEMPLERSLPVRRFTSRKGQRHLSGLWWSATTGGHVGFESWWKRDHVLHLDFDPSVVGIASQPLWLHWTDEGGLPSAEPRWPNKYIEYQVISLPRAARGKLRAIQSKTVDIRHSGLSQ
jgi:hypothetical protein